MQYYRPGDEVAPEHKLERFLGRGSFGEVWKAIAPGGVELAVKIINLTGGQGLPEYRAVCQLRRLRHPNLVPFFGFWLKDDRGYLIIEGDEQAMRQAGAAAEVVIAMGLGEKSLYDRLKECKRAGIKGIPSVELLNYIEDAAKALDYLNQPTHDLGQGPVGIPHGDIKPGNLLLIGQAAQVCDFGLARLLAPGPSTLMPAYLAPEMIENKPCRQTDQYSLAITYYELRTGERPFAASNPTTVLGAHQTGQLDFSCLTSTEQRVLRRATALDPSLRYPTAVEMVQYLRKASTAPSRLGSGGDLSAARTTQSSPELVPGYKLVRKIGQGGYGEVWEAIAPGGIRCAFKIISNLDASQNAQEFRLLELMKDLEHDHLMTPQAYWLLDAEGRILPEGADADSARGAATQLVLQTQLAAKNLAQRLKECQDAGWPGIQLQELLPYVRQAADALDYLNTPQHRLGDQLLSIQHRNIKPENLLLTKQNRVKISDFGLAKLVEAMAATLRSKSRGVTAAYTAPELFKGLVTPSTDQYSLATTYYRLRTGKMPFDANQSLYDMMRVHTEGRLDFGLLNQAEQEVLQRATKVNPNDRWPSCLAMVTALEAALGERPGSPAPPSPTPTASGPPPSGASERTRVDTTSAPPGDRFPPTVMPSTLAATVPPQPVSVPLKGVPPSRASVPPTVPPGPPPPHGETSVKLTRLPKQGARPPVVVPPPEPLEAVADLDAAEEVLDALPDDPDLIAPTCEALPDEPGMFAPAGPPPSALRHLAASRRESLWGRLQKALRRWFVRGPARDRVDCTVFAPPTVPREASFLVQVFVHTPDQADAASRQAKECDADTQRRAFKSLATQLERGTVLCIHLSIAGAQVEPPVQQLTWWGTRPETAQFEVRVPPDTKQRGLLGTVLVSRDGVPLGHIKFKLAIAGGPAPEAVPVGHAVRLYQQAFISYASKDRPEVLKRVQMLARLRIKYFQDVFDLEPGQRWESELYRHIDESDLFLLFWSSAARQSEWVRRELRYALQRKGADDEAPPEVLPVVIEGPPPPPPPEELTHLHFDDYLLYLMQTPTKP
jgi:serine/threonine protein kinase